MHFFGVTTDVFSAIAHTEVINEESDVVESEKLGPVSRSGFLSYTRCKEKRTQELSEKKWKRETQDYRGLRKIA